LTASPKKVFALNYDVADVDADTEPHLLADRSISILFRDGVLHFDSALHGIHSAGEVSDEAVTRGVEDPASMRRYQAIDDDPVSSEGAKGANLIESH
jgi:hypothetical protein